DWAKGWLGWRRGNQSYARREHSTQRHTQEPAEEKPQQDKPGEQGEAESSEELENRQSAGRNAENEIRRTKVDDILASCQPTPGTPVEQYLRTTRGIGATPPDCIRYRPSAFRSYGALVALATDVEGEVLAVQQIYLTEQGTKAPVDVVKRTNKAVDMWAEKAAVRFPGTGPLILAEGVETAMSIWQATGREAWACLGIANIGRAPVPDAAPVVIARDGDEPGSKADRALVQAVNALRARGHSVCVAVPPTGEDFNDVLAKQGPDGVKRLVDDAKVSTDSEPVMLEIGSDVEVAGRFYAVLVKKFGQVVHSEGKFWRYCETHWEPVPENELRCHVHAFDGALYPVGKGFAPVRLGKGRIDSIINEAAALCASPDFFDLPPTGINCVAGFIRFSEDGTPTLEPHKPDHRCRHTLPGRWSPDTPSDPPAGSLLFKLLNGVFQGDEDANEKIMLLAELCGSAALGYATRLKQPRAAIFHGVTAENGKSQILDAARGLLPKTAVCSVPAARMGDERHIIGLVGKLLNATDELSASAVASDKFKSVVTGEPIDGRDVYRTRVEFRSLAQNLFATNTLPPFHGGMDRGVQRRLLVLPFNRSIPLGERIEGIGRRVAEEEPDLLLAWAVKGASQLLKHGEFTIPQSCKKALHDWIYDADPVLAWAQSCVEVEPIVNGWPSIKTRHAYDNFKKWAVAEGYDERKLPYVNTFTTRVCGNLKGVEHHRKSTARVFLGLVIRREPPQGGSEGRSEPESAEEIPF
ncbi:MAG TPA: toprim domain-containing protein, partial [Verrucomicrobiae bacterium]|nr:toprim domain-containing protein [Verrucomicrobiae bacterium]